jgi:hypothetical protein
VWVWESETGERRCQNRYTVTANSRICGCSVQIW